MFLVLKKKEDKKMKLQGIMQVDKIGYSKNGNPKYEIQIGRYIVYTESDSSLVNSITNYRDSNCLIEVKKVRNKLYLVNILKSDNKDKLNKNYIDNQFSKLVDSNDYTKSLIITDSEGNKTHTIRLSSDNIPYLIDYLQDELEKQIKEGR